MRSLLFPIGIIKANSENPVLLGMKTLLDIFEAMAKGSLKGAGGGKRQREQEQAAQEKMTKQLKASAAAVKAINFEFVAP